MKISIYSLVGVLVASFTGAQTIVDEASGREDLSTLVTAIDAADLADTLSGEGPFTIFAPNDSAFEDLPDGVLAYLLEEENKDKLASILLYHVLPGEIVESGDITNRMRVETALEGEQIRFSKSFFFGTIRVNRAVVEEADISASNGVIHIIDSVLQPDSVEIPSQIPLTLLQSKYRTLVTLLAVSGLIDDLQADGPFTVFAPTNKAFNDLPAGYISDLLQEEDLTTLKQILLNHVVADIEIESGSIVGGETYTTLSGQTISFAVDHTTVTVEGAQVTEADIEALNGIIHEVDAILTPSAVEVPLDLSGAAEEQGLTTFLGAIETAGYDRILERGGPLTIFAPTNDAFLNLAAEDAESLEDIGELRNILRYHVTLGEYDTPEDGDTLWTLNRETVDISVAVDGTVSVNGNAVESTVTASNGIIHIINGVLLPPEKACTDHWFICWLRSIFG